jgi:endonuclease V-like protein UPF0215 family
LSVVVEAYDDGFFPYHFKARRGHTYLVGVEVEGASQTRRIASGLVRVDGRDVTKTIVSMSRSMRGSVVMLDGVIYAGFDVVDPHELYSQTGKGVLVVQLYPLNLTSIQVALQEHFEDWRERFELIKSVYSRVVRVDTPWRVLEVYYVGLDFHDVVAVLRRTCIYSPTPEPLRIADKIASTLSRLDVNRLYWPYYSRWREALS